MFESLMFVFTIDTINSMNFDDKNCRINRIKYEIDYYQNMIQENSRNISRLEQKIDSKALHEYKKMQLDQEIRELQEKKSYLQSLDTVVYFKKCGKDKNQALSEIDRLIQRKKSDWNSKDSKYTEISSNISEYEKLNLDFYRKLLELKSEKECLLKMPKLKF
ncbi:hypothetical protein EDEG_03472 [Edhazardia aedis USNM 41457]|uniref:Uncharacterized protein n=1 Tax=Edhazardia aedis (strain USNM 41457) TaxID=1003232 RepID=J9DL60_EDHAE|nr:hypothetical protein EDEG_03472 [Edhazardia aedis USNM 41457]|eukprot:EJW02087.1 hypothetical protein EDEG_03472 [Edhazardia aedis USNM 41457]